MFFPEGGSSIECPDWIYNIPKGFNLVLVVFSVSDIFSLFFQDDVFNDPAAIRIQVFFSSFLLLPTRQKLWLERRLPASRWRHGNQDLHE